MLLRCHLSLRHEFVAKAQPRRMRRAAVAMDMQGGYSEKSPSVAAAKRLAVGVPNGQNGDVPGSAWRRVIETRLRLGLRDFARAAHSRRTA